MDSAFKKLIYWSGHTHSLLGLAVHQLDAGIIMSISINEYTGKHASRRGNSILIVLILSIKNIFIVDAKVKELVYSGNTVFFLIPSRECMRENNFFLVTFTINDPLFHQFWFSFRNSIFQSFTTIIINVKVYCSTSFPPN